MARQADVFTEKPPVMLNTKLRPETKAKMEALARVQNMGGQRQLIEDMLAVYEVAKPEVAAKAGKLLEAMGY